MLNNITDLLTPHIVFRCRQQKLEEALLFTGMFQDALQSLLDWLTAVEPSLSTETAVMGDPETVRILIDNHKVRQALIGTLKYRLKRNQCSKYDRTSATVGAKFHSHCMEMAIVERSFSQSTCMNSVTRTNVAVNR